jgi:hypothetical protein
LLKALCGGSNTDIDQQDDGRRVNENSGPRSANPTESNPTRHSGSSSTQIQKSPDSALASVFGGLSLQQIVCGAVALFVALM